MKRLLILCGFIVASLSLLLAQDKDASWISETTSRENYSGVTLANGRIGLVSGEDFASIDEVVLAGVYDKESAEGVSRIVRGPNFLNVKFSIDGKPFNLNSSDSWSQALNIKEASFTSLTSIKDKISISNTLYALRHLPYMGLSTFTITAEADIELGVTTLTEFPEELTDTKAIYREMRDGKEFHPVYRSRAVTRTGMHRLATASAFLFEGEERPLLKITKSGKSGVEQVGFKVKLKKGETYQFAMVGAICSTKDFSDEVSEVERMVVFAQYQSVDKLMADHRQEWAKLWESDIIIEGDLEAQRDIRTALYHLYSFAREGSRLSIPPMGLSTVSGYNGHIFWDSEIWMYPVLLLFNRDMALSMLDYRLDHLQKAKQRAEIYGRKGAMFPWESDDSGEEATPTWCLTGPLEQHITADVGIAFWNYYRVYKDKAWLKEKGYPMLKEVADFWVSRVEKNDDGTYSINNVVGADEFAPNVDDNAFTNGSAKAVLGYAQLAARELGVEPDAAWKEVADNIKFRYMPSGVMLEHKRSDGEEIKQADVNLLTFPLGIVADKEQILRDLEYYEPKISYEGPAMGNSILSILHSRQGDAAKAYDLFCRSYQPNKRPPFGVLSESPTSDNPYFATGAGGMLQAVIFGFGGLDITGNGLVNGKGILPHSWKSLTLKGVGPDKRTVVISK